MAGQTLGPLRAAAAAVTIAATLLLCQPVSARPNEPGMERRQEVVDPAPSIWVSVGSDGAPHTITPVVTEANGASTTISAPPSSLTKTATYTLSPSGQASTLTGAPPVATAKDSSGEGLFLACQMYQGEGAPFCQPREGSLLNPGKSYYVTWASSYFSANSSTPVQLQVNYEDGDGDGFVGDRVPASQEYYVWNIDSKFLTNQGHSSLIASLSLAYSDEGKDELENRVDGPSVTITEVKSAGGDDGGGGGGVSAVAVAVPVVIVLIVLILGGMCFWSWRRHGTLPLVGSLGGAARRQRRASGAQGYGIGQSRSQRVGDGGVGDGVSSDKNRPDAGIQLTDRDSWSPTGGGGAQGRNVFREEMQRQQDRGR